MTRYYLNCFQRSLKGSAWVLGMLLPLAVSAQERDDMRVISTDTTTYQAPTEFYMHRDSIMDPHRVVTNKFTKDWFVFGEVGAHSLRGDYSDLGSFSGTLSPEWGLGFGKWFSHAIGLKAEFIRSDSRGYTAYENGHYGYGLIHTNSDGETYRKMKTRWWDLGASAMLNMSRLFCGYEGYNNGRLMNQIYLAAGIGWVHHMGLSGSGSDNEWSGHLELQYARFLDRKKHWSLDLKVRGLLYESNHDAEGGQADYSADKVDYNLGVNLGLTYYFCKGWEQSKTKIYQVDYREREVVVTQEREVAKPIAYKTLSFYVFFPNNYSGRDDAPLVAGAPVNALDYLAGGIYTQKQYVDAAQVHEALQGGTTLWTLPTTDLPTQCASTLLTDAPTSRGYELGDEPISLPLDSAHLEQFYRNMGYYYAPIANGEELWQYRIDAGTRTQHLLDAENYGESESFGLNAHAGLSTVRKFMSLGTHEDVVSFADVYAAMNGCTGYIAQYADSTTVQHVAEIFEHGIVTKIQLEGSATNQDNYTGADAATTRSRRNQELSEQRAATISAWLNQDVHLNDVSTQVFVVQNLRNSVQTVDETSTRSLTAKLNRCVKVTITYLISR